MTSIFNDLIISSSNQNGGLFFLSDKKFIKIDSHGTCGVTLDGPNLARGVQPDTLVIYSDPLIEIKREESKFYDIHDVIFFENHYYIVSTHTNEIIKFTTNGEEVRRWGFPGEIDSMHINCMAVWNNRIIFSAFGDFKLHRGYKTGSLKAGFVRDLITGEEIITGLSQPHSLLANNDNLILANSETGDILEYSTEGNLVRSKHLDGYTRGIAIQNNVLYVGISKTRNSPTANTAGATLVAIDLITLDIIDKINAPFDEIYSVIPAEQSTLIKHYDVLFEYALKREAEKIATEQLNTLNIQFDAKQLEFNESVENFNKEKGNLQSKWDAHRIELEMTIGNIKNEKNDLQNALLEAQKMEYELKIRESLHKADDDKHQLNIENQRLLTQVTDLQLSNERNVIDATKKLIDKETIWLENTAVTLRNHDAKISLLEAIISEKKETIYYQELVLTEAKKTSELHIAQSVSLTEQVAALQFKLSQKEQLDGMQSKYQEIVEQSNLLQIKISELEKENKVLVEKVIQTTEELQVQQSAAVEKEHAQKCHILELETVVESKEQKMNRELKKLNLLHEAEINKIITSRSWRITAPLRSIHRKQSTFKVSTKQSLIKAYSKAPLSISTRKSLKDFLFTYMPVFFTGSSTYQNWKAYKDLQSMSIDHLIYAGEQAQASQDSAVVATEDGGGVYLLNKNLQVADGVWEWEAYSSTRNAIKQIHKKLSSAEPAIPQLIDIQGFLYSDSVKSIILPELEEPPLVSIILPVYNNIKLTLECILSIQQYSGDSISYEIILADDASTDESEDILSRIPNIKYIRNENNLGFLRNCNNALVHATGNYTIYLNNDVQVTEGWLDQLYDTFSLYPDAGAVGPKFIYPSGHLQEAGAAFNTDGTSTMIGLNENPLQERFSYTRRVDYVSGACLMLPTALAKKLGGFSEEFLPCYCEDSDLCLRIEKEGYFIYCNPSAVLIHHLSKTTAAIDNSFKMKCIANNVQKLKSRWSDRLQKANHARVIALYLPQFHPFPENDKWWGVGFTEWTNVAKAKPNFVGHYQPRLPADLGYYDLRLPEIMAKQAEMAKQYGVGGFCFYYYWFDGKRLLERPIEQLLLNKSIDFPFCVCWANENWTRRWDGQEHDVLMAQAHSPADDRAVILDLIRYFSDSRYVRIDGKPLIVVYRVTLFPDFKETAELWRKVCIEEGIGEIYIAMVESFDLVHSKTNPKQFGCDAAIEFPPQGLADQKAPSGEIINPEFAGSVADYKSLAIRYATREQPAYTRFMGAMPGWDNTARRQNNSFCFEHATPGVFQAWLEEILEQTRLQHYGDERIVFINAWNEWAEGAYLEPDKRFGHSYLEAVKNALDADKLLKNSSGF